MQATGTDKEERGHLCLLVDACSDDAHSNGRWALVSDANGTVHGRISDCQDKEDRRGRSTSHM